MREVAMGVSTVRGIASVRLIALTPARCAVAVVAVSLVAGGCSPASSPSSAHSSPLPLHPVGEVALPGDESRFDYASLDSGRGLLFIAHLGASEVVEADVHAHTVVRTIPDLAQVHGVLVVPELRRVYATATGVDQMAVVDEDTGAVVNRAPTGRYPDGLAYDPKRYAVWTTNESGGSETVIDAGSAAVRGTVDVGGDAGNVVYDPVTDRMLVAVQGRGDLAVIDPAALAVAERIALPGCDHPHGLALDPAAGAAFVACDGNATLLSVDLASRRVTGSNRVGDGPDVLAYDQSAHRLYVAAESGEVTVLDQQDGALRIAGSGQLADAAHVVAVDPATHHTYFPIPAGASGGPVLLERAPTAR
jgi:DNA-binding beta-propeller fold protein YncE